MTTAGVIAVGNLAARIDGQVPRATEERLTVGERGELVELIALRGQVLGCIADAEWAAALADELVDRVPTDPRAFVARARMRGVFHRFASALTDLDTAAALGGDQVERDAERAAIFQALGRYEEALAIRRLAVDRHADFSALAALAGVYGERAEMDEAERSFRAATRCYRGISPFPLAMLEFQRGKLWMEHDDLRRARAWFHAAVRRLPAYVPAQGHLAELDAALGETALAIARLRPLALASDDPDYATHLARILSSTGQPRRRTPGVARRKPAMTNCSRVTTTRSPIMPPNSGSRSAAITSERSGSLGTISHSARPLVLARSCAARAAIRRASGRRRSGRRRTPWSVLGDVARMSGSGAGSFVSTPCSRCGGSGSGPSSSFGGSGTCGGRSGHPDWRAGGGEGPSSGRALRELPRADRVRLRRASPAPTVRLAPPRRAPRRDRHRSAAVARRPDRRAMSPCSPTQASYST